jgi:aldose 1-epimerase
MDSREEDSPQSSCSFLSLGAIIQAFMLPTGSNLVLNFPTPELYQEYNEPYFGETIGRVANRISGARIKDLNGRSYDLAANNGPNCLHGGKVGWGKKLWSHPQEVMRSGSRATEFFFVSPDGDEGFPGKVAVKVWYTQGTEKTRGGENVNVLEIEYEAELVGNEEGITETVIGMTNHRLVAFYFL